MANKDGVNIFARQFLNENYESLMRLFSIIYTELETYQANESATVLAIETAFYTVVSFFQLNCTYDVHIIVTLVHNNKERQLNKFEIALARLILLESRIHDLETLKIIKVIRQKNGNSILKLIKREQDIDFNLSSLLQEIRDANY